MGKTSKDIFDNAVDGGRAQVCGHGFTFAVDVRDLSNGGGDGGEIEENSGADGTGEDFDAEEELWTERGAYSEMYIINGGGKRECSNF